MKIISNDKVVEVFLEAHNRFFEMVVDQLAKIAYYSNVYVADKSIKEAVKVYWTCSLLTVKILPAVEAVPD